MQRVGIEKIWVYPCSMSLDLGELAKARGLEETYPVNDLMMRSRGVSPCWEDPITTAVNAAKPMLSQEDIDSIELLIVGTESSPDQGKPISTFVHRFLGLPDNCRNFETKHACYGGTCAAMMAAHWVASGAAGDAKALVIATDQSRMHLGSPWEYVMGAIGVAMLISNKPDVLEYDLRDNAYWTKEVGDTFRPTSREEAGNTENSVYCYLEALEGAFAHYKQKHGGSVDLEQRFAKHIYHVPFAGMVKRAHRQLMRETRKMSRKEADAHFDEKVAGSLVYNSQCGGTYTASTFVALTGLLDQYKDLSVGDRISIFAYGSGSCAEFYSGLIGPNAYEAVARAAVQEKLDARYRLSVEEYEAVETERTSYIDMATYQPSREGLNDHYKRFYEGKGYLVLKGLEGHFRHYEWS
ncbi:MAG: hydroxymethylglutaryl-CoA synthase family protein [Myxococcales bacterium]|nr:hydroxymethylglutaryl-CoA synthase family protein [Myxococcales bacterium]MCB9643877.1 hydroxymethylglutaryl-CoA synthase family protein [Myxococcales bacterium]